MRVDALWPYPKNARTHSKKQIQKIAASIREFGFTNPLLIDSKGSIVAGHGRLEAAKALGLVEVPTIRLDHLSETQVRAYVLADNKLATLAGWDPETLKSELRFLTSVDLDFNVDVTGFECAKIDYMVNDDKGLAPGPAAADEAPALFPDAAVSRNGDLWALGSHRVLCGDARDPASYEQLLERQKANLVFTNPPCNIPIDSMAKPCGEASTEFATLLRSAVTNLVNASADGSIHFVCIDWRSIGDLMAAAKGLYTELKDLAVWNKDYAEGGSFYRSKHELIFVFKSGSAPHINTFELSKKGRARTNVWSYAGPSTIKASTKDELTRHPSVMPVALVADAIRDCSKPNQIVLDPFLGSGTTLMAADITGRRAYGLEVDPIYTDLAIRRYETYTGVQAVHLGTEKTFAEIAAERGRPVRTASSTVPVPPTRVSKPTTTS